MYEYRLSQRIEVEEKQKLEKGKKINDLSATKNKNKKTQDNKTN